MKEAHDDKQKYMRLGAAIFNINEDINLLVEANWNHALLKIRDRIEELLPESMKKPTPHRHSA